MHFEKITYNQWLTDMTKYFGGLNEEKTEEISNMYKDIKLPKRATKYSAGYDFFIPANLLIPMEENVVIPTGIRWVCDKEEDKNKVLSIYPRSGLGFKTGIHLMNTVGIIDADYYEADNEGHIMIKMCNPMGLHTNPRGNIEIKIGEAFAQGIISKFYTCDDEEKVETQRTGGMGSTD
jgi:dUTP pyrophosphatase